MSEDQQPPESSAAHPLQFPPPPTPAPTDTPPLATCLQLLARPSDAEKFAGLMLVPRVVSPNDTALHSRIVDAVGAKFLFRLLATEGSPGNKRDGDNLYANRFVLRICLALCACVGCIALRNIFHMYRTVALRILSSFAAVPAISSSNHLPQAAPLLVRQSIPPLHNCNIMRVCQCDCPLHYCKHYVQTSIGSSAALL